MREALASLHNAYDGGINLQTKIECASSDDAPLPLS